MGFLFHAIKINITGAFFLSLWSHLKYFIIGALTHLGLYKPPPEEDNSGDNSNNYIFILEGTCPSLVPIPVHVVTAAIKNRVPIVQYQDLRGKGHEASAFAEKMCTICLEPIDLKHEVRELCRCTHVFHRDCLDTWVDSGQVTCPLCRSMLLPPKTNLYRCAGDPPPPSSTTSRSTTTTLGMERNAPPLITG